jgi:hypothetical protein
MGDVCCGIPAFLALHAKIPGAQLYWLTLAKYQSLIPPCGIIVISPHEPFGAIPKPLIGYDHAICAQPMWRESEWRSMRMHAIDCIATWSNVAPLTDRRIILPTNQLPNIQLPEKFVAICSSPSISCGNYFLIPMRQHITNYCIQRGISVVTVGGADGVVLQGAIPLHGKLSPLQTVAVINQAIAYVGPDTGTTWLACGAPKTKKICVLDRNRFSVGVVGFQLTDPATTKDIFIQDGLDKVITSLEQYL